MVVCKWWRWVIRITLVGLLLERGGNMTYLYEVNGTVAEMFLDESDFYNEGYDE